MRAKLRHLVYGILLIGTTAFIAGQNAPTASELVATLKNSSVDKERWQAAVSLGGATFADEAERKAALDALVEGANSRETGLRVNALTSLGMIADPASIPALSRALSDPSPLARQAAARALGRVGTEDAARALLRGMSDPLLSVRAYAIKAMGEAAQPIAAGALSDVLLCSTNDPNAPLRTEAAKALERMGSYALDSLLKGVASGDPDIRRAAAGALAGVGDPRAMKQLIRLLGDPNPQVTSAAISAIVRIGDSAIKDVIEAFDTAATDAVGHLTTALGEIGAPAVQPLRDLYVGATNRLQELEVERQKAEEELEARTRAPQPEEQAAPVQQEPQRLPAPSDAQVKQETRQLKRQMKTQEKAAKRYEELVMLRRQMTSLDKRIDVAQKELTEPTAIPKESATIVGITPLATTPQEVEKQIELPAQTPTTRAGAPVPVYRTRPIALIDQDIDKFRRRAHAAILALGRIGNDEAVVELTRILQQPSATETTLAAEALGRSDNANAVPALLTALTNAQAPSGVRANAALGLGRLRAPQATTALRQAYASDPSTVVRNAARDALRMLGGVAQQTPAPTPPGSTQ